MDWLRTAGFHVRCPLDFKCLLKLEVLTTQLTSPINVCFVSQLKFDLQPQKCPCTLQGPADVVETEDDDEKSCKTAKSCGGGGGGV